MKKFILACTLIATTLCAATASDIPASFPRKFLLEQFTAQSCGNCPYGMLCIAEAMQQDSGRYIWVAHHYGFASDEYTISESRNICNLLGVTGAPIVSLNRTKQEINGIPQLTFHPAYLPSDEINIVDSLTSPVSVLINRTYDPETRVVNLTVSGQVADTTIKTLKLSALIKENAITGNQTDCNFAWGSTKQWREYLHMATARDFFSPALGDEIKVENQAYSKSYTMEIPTNWVDTNCTIVAYVTKSSNAPVLNAEQAPLVEETQGGEQFKPYGVIQDAKPKTTILFSDLDQTKVAENILQVIMVSNQNVRPDNSGFAYGTCKPVGLLYVVTTDSKLKPGTYSILDDYSANSIIAGFRVDEMGSLSGSLLVYSPTSYIQAGQIFPAAMWRLLSGTLTVTEEGNFTLNANTCYGTEIQGTYSASTGIENVTSSPANQAIYNMLGIQVGNNLQDLPQGVYIQNGKVVIKQ
ncbi:MAG: Omp28-related outer membrane protein [Paludibacteraceae bacterium]